MFAEGPMSTTSPAPARRLTIAQKPTTSPEPDDTPTRDRDKPTNARGRLREFLRGAMEQDIRRTLRRLIRPGDRVLEVTAGPRSYATEIPDITCTVRVLDVYAKSVFADDFAKLAEAGSFEVVFIQGVVSYARDLQEILTSLRPLLAPDTRLVLLSYNAFWAPVLRLASSFGLRARTPDENWLSSQDVENLFRLADLDLVSARRRVLLPSSIAGLSGLANRFLVALPGLTNLGLCDWYVARAAAAARPHGRVSVVVPARNEAGNIERILREMPKMGTGVEVIFVEGHSTDDTWRVIQEEVAKYDGHAEVRAFQQQGKGKKDASFLAFEHATGDYLMILDADVTVRPAELPKFYDALRSGKGELINGSRLMYPMQEGAMRFLNLLGNRFFAAAFSYIIGQQLKDTLCGTKALSHRDWERLNQLRAELGERDPFGDFDLLFGASRLDLKLVEIPIRYQARTYGTTNISRFRHGWMLLKMCAWGLTSLKFV
jgi:hypothetical protein